MLSKIRAKENLMLRLSVMNLNPYRLQASNKDKLKLSNLSKNKKYKHKKEPLSH